MRAAVKAVVGWQRDLAWALLVTLIAFAISAGGGFKAMTNSNGDNDSLLRLVEVRDFMAGQGWFDLHQYRMGPEGGFLMHWSRLIDASLSALISVAEAFGLSTTIAESFARAVWPTLTYWLTVFFVVRAARRFGGDAATFPAMVIAGAALFFMGAFAPGNIDHHNVQLLLVMAAVNFLLAAPDWRPAALLSGASAALSLAIGMETAPLVAAIGACVAGLFLFSDRQEARTASGFGLGFAGVSALVLVSTIAPSNWGVASCDAFSAVQFAVAVISGVGLAAAASTGQFNASVSRRLCSLVLLAGIVAVVVILLFPQCLRDPYANLDPRLRALWLDNIEEAQSLFQLMKNDRASVIGSYVTPLIALVLLAFRLVRGDRRREVCVVTTLLFVAFAISVWQVRGMTFSITLAVIPLAAWVATWRERTARSPSLRTSMAMVLVWLVSINALWTMGTALATMLTDTAAATGAGSAASECNGPAEYATLATMPVTTVLAVSNLGSPILAYTNHRALAGPYHRNVKGNLLVLDAFTGPVSAAEAIVRGQHVGLIAVCRGNAETSYLTDVAPDGFLADLIKGRLPIWLEPVPGTAGKPLALYRVRSG
ncbi:polysaccharide biosynthesis protein GtrA [Mesorhizobium loti]|nr:polysaccharide biosynthesis protein GtrA [Mesorhizobium loti]PLP56210.1 polysaccharide biosynthesis protein GtrA [Mesorhizobium loti]